MTDTGLVALDSMPAGTRGTFLSALLPTLEAAGAPCSEARLAGIFGHAFTFSMNRAGSEVWQLANIEWCFLFRELDLLPFRFDAFDAVLKGPRPAPSAEELRAMKERTWQRVVEGIDRGIPSIAWGAMTTDQRGSGVTGFEWNMLVGYDAGARTYLVRHLPNEPSWMVPYDGFGYCDPVQWYHVMTPAEPRNVDLESILRRSLIQAVEYAQGKRFDPPSGCNPVDAIGLMAYRMFRDALSSGDAAFRFAPAHASFLGWARSAAARFLREMEKEVHRLRLEPAAEHYDNEARIARELEAVCREGASRRFDAVRLVDAALDSEQRAIGALESALRSA